MKYENKNMLIIDRREIRIQQTNMQMIIIKKISIFTRFQSALDDYYWSSSYGKQSEFDKNAQLYFIERGSIVVRAHASHAEGLRFEPNSMP